MAEDMETLRNTHESDNEWRLRKAFLLAHQDRFPEERLICLSNCFINIEMYGTSYPPGVMRTLHELSIDIKDDIDEVRRQKKERSEVKFVKASNSGNAEISTQKSSFSSSLKKMNFVKEGLSLEKNSESNFSVASQRINSRLGLGASPGIKKNDKLKKSTNDIVAFANYNRKSEEDQKFYVLSNAVRESKHDITTSGYNVIQFLHNICNRHHMTPGVEFSMEGHRFLCELHIDFVLVSKEFGSSKKVAKYHAYENAIERLQKPYLHVDRVNPEKMQLESSDEPLDVNSSTTETSVEDGSGMMKLGHLEVATRGMKRLHPEQFHQDRQSKFSKFIIVEHTSEYFKSLDISEVKEENEAGVMHRSSDFNQTVLKFEYNEGSDSMTRCRLLLDLDCLADVSCVGNKSAKDLACHHALNELRKICWTLRVKKYEDTDVTGLSRDEILGNIGMQSEQISDSNVGNKLLKKMGWTGGGVGKNGGGISEPIDAGTMVINRQGLGLQTAQGIHVKFAECIKKTLHNYSQSNNQYDMSFASDFSREERAIIHAEARKLRLKSKSKGNDEERYLIISRKRNADQLFNHIQRCGGSTSKYDLIPPATL